MRQRIIVLTLGMMLMASLAVAEDEGAIAALRKADAIVERDESQTEKPIVKVVYNLRQITEAGIEALKELEELPAIEFQGTGDTEISVTTMRALQGKRSLKKFAIANAKMSDEAAKVLGTLTSLDVLDFRSQNDLSPNGLQQIFKLTNLKELTLTDRLVNDGVLAQLSAFPKLKILSIRSVFVTDEGLASLKNISHLQTLRIFIGAEITESGIQHLAVLQLKELDLSYSGITNAKLKSLRKFSGLKSLRFINASGVTDEGISSLVELTELTQLDLADAKLSKVGVAKLKKELPKCAIKNQPINLN